MYLILTQCFPSRFGGIESVVSNLALNLGKKNKVIVFADRHHIIQDTIYDNKHKDIMLVRRFGGIKFFRRRKKIKALKLFIESQNIKFVIADTWKSIELCIDYLNEKNIHVLCLAHGNELFSNKTNKKKRIVSTLNKSSVIIANSNYTADLVKKMIKNRNHIKVVYPGAEDLRLVKPNNFISIKGDPILLTLARLEKRKGHAEILLVLKKLINFFPNIKYIIAGEGDQKNNLKKLVNEYDLEKSVKFTGNVNEQQKKHLFDHTSVMIMPTLDESHNRSIEGFGIVYLEAAFFGIPSVASKVGGTTEAVLDEKTGVIINNHEQLFETLKELLQNKDKLKRLGENAKKRADQLFTWDKVANNYFDILK